MLPVRLGGLGLRSAFRHSAAAFLSSRSNTRELCMSIDPCFVVSPADDEAIVAAIPLYNDSVSTADATSIANLSEQHKISQKSLSARVDARAQEGLLATADVSGQARIQAAAAPHAGAWLAAQPASGLDQRMSHADFATASKLILGLPILPADSWCPRCDQVMDRRCAHAMACMSGGDALALHNELRDSFYIKFLSAGLSCEHEQPGLLPDDPRRRPGDLFLPAWPGGRPVALDFAVTCPLQLSTLRGAATAQLAAATEYEAFKFGDRDTAARCHEQGIRLIPMVAESLGGWGHEAQAVFKTLGRQMATQTGTSHGAVVAQLYENMSVKIMRAAARSALARAAESSTSYTFGHFQ